MKRVEDAERNWLRVISIRESKAGPDNFEIANSLVNLGSLYEKAQKAERAEQSYTRALAISEKKLGPESYGITSRID
ncbi:MAG: tetratricopeptide repeat protein [Acidobacteriota bacterium]|nr:tetratricopeptide repeat protein [Acidobacteriota bacterium]